MSKGKKNKQINHEKDLMKDLLHKDFKTIVLKMYKELIEEASQENDIWTKYKYQWKRSES